jgi:glyoxylate/hydroxypyruvate reductase A
VTFLIALSWEPAPWVERFSRLLPNERIAVLGEPFDRSQVRYAATWGPQAGSLDDLPNLELLFSLGAGVDHLMRYPGLPDVPIVRVIEENLTNRMSEYVVMHALMHLRDQRRYDAQQRAKVWEENRSQPAAGEVRVGMLGFGVLGQDAARKLQVMGFEVAGWSRTRKSVDWCRTYAGEAELDAFLRRTDILVCLLPLTPDTRGLLSRDLFRKLARDGRLGGPILMNVARGGLQVEADILACLEDGTLKAATLDVFETEPLPQASPLWSHPAVTISPHSAATSEPDATARHIVEQIRRHEAGEPLQGVVDRERGY